MALFDRKASNNPPPVNPHPELSAMVRNRGQAEVQQAEATVYSVVGRILGRTGAWDHRLAGVWALDKLRLFMVHQGARYLETFEDIPEFPQLNAEYQSLVRNAERIEAAHLLAWWWQMDPELFKPILDEQLQKMEDALVEAAEVILSAEGDFASELVDWDSVLG